MKKMLSLTAALSLASCTTFSDMDSGLTAFNGKPAQNVFSVLGMPYSEGVLSGQKYYYWENSFSMAMPSLVTANTTGQIGSTPMNFTTTSTQWQNNSYECKVRIFVDANEIVQAVDWQGNIGGCQAIAKRLRKASH